MKEIFSDEYYDRINLRGMSFHGYTGVFDFEKEQGQIFVIDITLFFRRLQAVSTDCLRHTVHYGEVFDLTKSIVEAARGDLIEHLAEQIIQGVLCKFSLPDAIETTVSKPDAPVDGHFSTMSVTIFRRREDIKLDNQGGAK